MCVTNEAVPTRRETVTNARVLLTVLVLFGTCFLASVGIALIQKLG